MRLFECVITLDLGVAGEQECHVKYRYTPADNGGREYPSTPEEVEIEEAKFQLSDLTYIDVSMFDISDELLKECMDNQLGQE